MTPSAARAALLLALAALVLVVGQTGRDLLQPDDMREAEVAREMWADGDVVIPRLAGVPFVEKPPAFPAAIASSFELGGGPSVTAGRAVAASFALASIAAVFLLGRRAMGTDGGALAAAALAFAARFCRTAHEILLDGALTATFAFALLAAWTALDADDVPAKRRAYVGCAFCLGIAFLFKGLVGPALFFAGALPYLFATRRWSELRHALRPLSVAAFVVPVAVWLVPFLLRASPDLVRAFFIDNHFGRATGAFGGGVRPFWFYAADVWPSFAPASALLPFAARAAWREGRTASRSPGLFFLAFAVGPAALLTLADAKASAYLLPAYPALALLCAWWANKELELPRRASRVGVAAFVLALFVLAAGVVVASAVVGGGGFWTIVAAAALGGVGAASWHAWRRDDPHATVAAGAALCALGWTVWFTGPIATEEIRRRTVRPESLALLAAARGREVFLYGDRLRDGVRGALSFYRGRTSLEVGDPRELVDRLLVDADAVAVVEAPNDVDVPRALLDAASARRARIRVESAVAFGPCERLTLIRADAAQGPAKDAVGEGR